MDIFSRRIIYINRLMILKKLTLTALLIVTAVFAVFAQDDTIPLRTIIEKTAKYTANFPTEKVYVHFDKPYYAVGDTIWLKAYVTIYNHQPSGLSKIVYVDLINSRDSVVQQLRLPVVNGTAWGNITLPQLTFQEGNYHVRAYTNWMRNFDAAYFFSKNITIGSVGDVTNPVNTHISFTNALQNTSESITAHLTYKDQDGLPYINRRVTWKVQNDDETIAKGKGITDGKGNVDISFTSDKPSVFGASDLVTELELSYKLKTIVNSFPLKTASIPVDVQFFPEGGDMLSNVTSKIAFKAISSNGLGVDVKGTVTDDANNVVAEFTSQHIGMGVFTLLPKSGKLYKATVTFPDGTKNSYDLPRVLDEGINLTVNNNNPDSLNLKISSNPDFLQKFLNTKFYIIIQGGGNVYYAAQTALQSLVYTASIPKSKFPTGIIQVTLLSSEGDPLSERLVFIQHNDLLNVAINTAPTYTTRQHVRMNLSVKNKDVPVAGTFSLSVIDETKVPYNEDNETTILSSLLLTSDLKGFIEKPNYYFNHVDATRLADLDVLMMTQGFRRFNYYDIVADKTPSIFNLPEQGIDVAGTLRTLSGVPVPRGNLHLIIPDKIFATDVTSDYSGNFRFSNVVFQDSSQLIVSAKNNPNGKYMMVMVNGETAPGLTKNINAPENVVNIDSTLSTYLQNNKKQYATQHVLKEVVIKAEAVKVSHADYPALSGLNQQADHEVNANQLTGCNDLLECLKVTAFGVTYNTDDGEFYITRDFNQGNKSQHVQVYANGMPVETNFLSTIDPKTVDNVEIFLNDGLSGINKMTDTKGIIVVNVKKMPKGEKISIADLKKMLPQQNEVTISPMGYAKTRDFYVPKYLVPKSSTYSPPDLRTTVYWNPKIVTDKTGKATFDFYNADGKGTYKAVLEGLDFDGNIARYIYTYKVE